MNDELTHLLYRISTDPAVDEGRLHEARQKILEAMLAGLKVSRAGVWLLNETQDTIGCNLLIDTLNNTTSEGLELKRSDFPRYFAALDRGRRIVSDDACRHPDTAEFAECYLNPLGITSMLDVPIRHRGVMIGILCLEHQGPMRQWQTEEQIFATTLAGYYGRAVSAHEREMMAQQLHTLNQTLEAKVEGRTHELQEALQNMQRIQKELVGKEKMATLGMLSAGIAHEVNNPNNFIQVGTQNVVAQLNALNEFIDCLLDGSEDSDIRSAFDVFFTRINGQMELISEGSRRVDEVVKNLLTACRTDVSKQQNVDVIAGLENTLKLVLPNFQQRIRFDLQLSFRPTLVCWPAELNQVFLNIIMNACQAIESRSDVYAAATGLVCISSSLQEGSLVIEISDNGEGISEDILQRIFDPFFTTRPIGQGTGLGLSISRDILNKHGGKLEVTSTPNQGTSMKIWLPCEDAMAFDHGVAAG